MSVFEVTGGVEVYVEDEKIGDYDSVDVEALKRIAKEHGVKKFTVTGADGEELTGADFPVTEGSLTIKPYYEAK